MIKRFSIGLLAAAAAISAPAVAGTHPVEEARTIAVSYRDLNLDTAEGQRMLQRRLQVAAREVCAMGERHTGSLTPSASSRTCYVRAMNNLQREVAARTGRLEQRG